MKDCPPPADLDSVRVSKLVQQIHAHDTPLIAPDNVTAVIGTYGESWWHTLAETRAVPSARALGVQVVHVHADTLHDARNRGLAEVETDWVVFVDADDELEPNYLQAMGTGAADLRAPSVRYMRGRTWQQAYVPRVAGHTHVCVPDCLLSGNWLVVGSAVLAELVRGVGGWREFAWSEDWDLWLRCYQAGATIEAVPDAVYRAYVRSKSRNRAPRASDRYAAHKAIADANGIGMPA